ncbi:uncharacterized protein N0V89_005925 [Didymosphaeria variabile]|uniref:Uncharacterized protein n=1 Tax=Didymosphaeria variabile TaxID=1932322 RepID=A0A9W8XM99_9PLEO|nr:uncharacterized protein N0V89_005925 [Didymosphaeria variabile]KAJ4354191.1 hypothetical protein N0V89_005925 [Didymosphaeria variabile]
MQFSTSFLLFALPFLAAAAPADLHAEPIKNIETRNVPGCVVRSEWGGEWTEGGLARYRTKFTAAELPSADVCDVPYFTCLAMSNRQCWTEGDTTFVDGSYVKGAGFDSYKACLQNAKQQWAKDNGCACEGEFC